MGIQERLSKWLNQMDFVSQDKAAFVVKLVVIIVTLISYGVGYHFQKFSYVVYSVLAAMVLLIVVLVRRCRWQCPAAGPGGSSLHVHLQREAEIKANETRPVMCVLWNGKLWGFDLLIIIMLGSMSRRLVCLSNQLIFQSSSSASPASNIEFVEGQPLPKVVLNRPKALNSLNLQMVRDLAALIPKLEQYPAYWIEGAGGKAFCAGGDVKALFENGATLDDRELFFRDEFTTDYRLATSKAIEIANWDGIVMGGGVGVSQFAPFRIATENTMFAMPEAKIGFFTDVGCGATLASLRSNIGMYIALTSGRLKGEEVYTSGFANYFVKKESIPAIYEEINSQIKGAKSPRETIENVLKKYHKGDPNKKLANEDEINYIFGGSSVKEIYDRAQQSKTSFGQSVLKGLGEVCPLSLHAIFKLVRESNNLDKKTLFKRDFVVAQNFIVNKNFENGVTSLLITKDNKPQWTHKSISEVPQAEVDALFSQNPQRKPLEL